MADPQEQQQQQARLKQLSDQYQDLQAELQSTVDARQKLDTQLQENSTVLAELELIRPSQQDDEARSTAGKVYKKIGPVLVKQDTAEAVLAVKSRLDFIKKEISRIEDQIKATQEKIETVKNEVIKIQTSVQEDGAAV